MSRPPSTAVEKPGSSIAEVVDWLHGRPLAIDRQRIGSLEASLRMATVPQAFYFFFEPPDDDDLDIQDSVAVIRIRRALRTRTYKTLRDQVQRALDDSRVKGLFFDIDSPGGDVDGLFELVDFLHAARAQKPMRAIANHWAASAAYAIASSVTPGGLSVSRTAGVGSVGVIAVHVEYSKMDERIGVKFTPVYAGERKKDLIDTEPIDPTARELLQDEVDRLWEMFLASVARNRGMSVEAVRETQAGVFYAAAAVDAHFADRVASYDEALTAFKDDVREGRATANTDPVDDEDDEEEEIEMSNPKDNQPETTATEAATATPAAATTTQPAKGADVVDIESARTQGAAQARTAEKDRISEIKSLCELAGADASRALGFIEAGTSLADVKKELLADRAKASQEGGHIDGHHSGAKGTGAKEPAIDSTAIYEKRRQAMSAPATKG